MYRRGEGEKVGDAYSTEARALTDAQEILQEAEAAVDAVVAVAAHHREQSSREDRASSQE